MNWSRDNGGAIQVTSKVGFLERQCVDFELKGTSKGAQSGAVHLEFIAAKDRVLNIFTKRYMGHESNILLTTISEGLRAL